MTEVRSEATLPWATFGTTESGDDLPIFLWAEKPSREEVEERYRAAVPVEYEEVGHVCWKIKMVSP